MNPNRLLIIVMALFFLTGCADEHYMPDASFNSTFDNGNTHAPSHVTFTHINIQCEKPYSHYLWHFGDGDSSIILNPNHVFDTTGTFMVKLKMITDNNIDEKQVSITILPPYTSFNISNIHLTVPFTQPNSSLGDMAGTGDDSGDPDIFVVLKNGIGDTILTTPFLINELLWPEFSVDLDIFVLNDDYSLEIYDYESGPVTLMGTIGFNPYNDIHTKPDPYPANYIIISGGYKAEMTVSWN
jgi:hypothetical protein